MRLRTPETYWLLKNGVLGTYPSLAQDISCEVLVVGGGITGALMAFQFSSEGYQTVLIDKRDVSQGSTSATTSLLQYELDEPLYTLIDKIGEEPAVETYREGVRAIEKLEKLVTGWKANCGFAKKESLYLARTQKDQQWLSKEFDCRNKYGFDVTWLPRTHLQRYYGIDAQAGILSGSGASLDAYQLSHFLMLFSNHYYGLRIYDNTGLVEVDYSGSRNVVKTTESNTITCRHIVYATGFETQSMLKDKVVSLLSTYAFITEPIPHLPPNLSSTIFWDTSEPYLYFRSTSDNRLLIGGADESFKDPDRRDRLVEKKEKELVGNFKALIPGLDITSEFAWAGTFGKTKDAMPYIGAHPDFPNSWFVLGFGGNGITFSIMGMEILSDAIAGRENRFLEYFKFKR